MPAGMDSLRRRHYDRTRMCAHRLRTREEPMGIVLPTTDQVHQAAAALGLVLSEDDAASYRELMGPLVAGYQALDAIPVELPKVKYPRTPGSRPRAEDNPYNAWYYRTSI